MSANASAGGDGGNKAVTVASAGDDLGPADARQVEKLKQADRQTRQDLQASKAAAGQYARGGPKYTYVTGPDGRRYAVAGELQVDVSPVPGDPQTTAKKMAAIRRAAFAGKSPPASARAVAAEATRVAAKAQSEISKDQDQDQGGAGPTRPAAKAEVKSSRGAHAPAAAGQQLDEQEKKEVSELKQEDRDTRQHERTHKAAAGAYARGGPSYTFVTGPDGRRYALAGEVKLDLSPVPNDPEATVQKMRVIHRAALAPRNPSSADRAIAAQANRIAAAAQREERTQQREQAKAGGQQSAQAPAYAQTAVQSGGSASAPESGSFNAPLMSGRGPAELRTTGAARFPATLVQPLLDSAYAESPPSDSLFDAVF